MSVGGIRPGGGLPDLGATDAPAASAPAAGLASPKLAGNDDLEAIARGDQTFASGSKGEGVKKFQQALMDAGYALPRWGADGGYGNEAIVAVKKLQKDSGLPETGIADKATLQALDRKLAPRPAGGTSTTGGAGAAGGTGGTGAAGGAGGTSATSAASGVTVAGAGAAGIQNSRFSDPSLAPVASGRTSLGPGAKGEGVKACQQALMDLGYALPRFGADGGFGGEMTKAIKRFQVEVGLPRTGKIDKPTLEALDRTAPPAGKTLEKYPEYDKIYEDGRADMTLAFGYDENGMDAGQVEGTLRGLCADGFRKVNPGSLTAAEKTKYGLTSDRVEAGISYYVKDFRDPASGKPVCAVAKILTPTSASTPEGVAAMFKRAIERDDAVLYDGHARYGTGPDFDDIDSGRGNFVVNPTGNLPDMGGSPAPGHLLDAIKGKPNGFADTRIPNDKYRLLFFDSCSSENYLPSLRKQLGSNSNANVDVVATTIPTQFASGPAHMVNFATGITRRESINSINRKNNEAEVAAVTRTGGDDEADAIVARATMIDNGFIGNRGNRIQ